MINQIHASRDPTCNQQILCGHPILQINLVESQIENGSNGDRCVASSRVGDLSPLLLLAFICTRSRTLPYTSHSSYSLCSTGTKGRQVCTMSSHIDRTCFTHMMASIT